MPFHAGFSCSLINAILIAAWLPWNWLPLAVASGAWWRLKEARQLHGPWSVSVEDESQFQQSHSTSLYCDALSLSVSAGKRNQIDHGFQWMGYKPWRAASDFSYLAMDQDSPKHSCRRCECWSAPCGKKCAGPVGPARLLIYNLEGNSRWRNVGEIQHHRVG